MDKIKFWMQICMEVLHVAGIKVVQNKTTIRRSQTLMLILIALFWGFDCVIYCTYTRVPKNFKGGS